MQDPAKHRQGGKPNDCGRIGVEDLWTIQGGAVEPAPRHQKEPELVVPGGGKQGEQSAHAACRNAEYEERGAGIPGRSCGRMRHEALGHPNGLTRREEKSGPGCVLHRPECAVGAIVNESVTVFVSGVFDDRFGPRQAK